MSFSTPQPTLLTSLNSSRSPLVLLNVSGQFSNSPSQNDPGPTSSTPNTTKKRRRSSGTRLELDIKDPFSCCNCGRGYMQQQSLTRHLKTCLHKSLNTTTENLAPLPDLDNLQSVNKRNREELEVLQKDNVKLKRRVDKLRIRKNSQNLRVKRLQGECSAVIDVVGHRRTKPYSQLSKSQARTRRGKLYKCAVNIAGNRADAASLILDSLIVKYGFKYVFDRLQNHPAAVKLPGPNPRILAASKLNSTANLLRTAQVIFDFGRKMPYRQFKRVRHILNSKMEGATAGVPLAPYEIALAFCRRGIADLELNDITKIFPTDRLEEGESGMYRDLEPLVTKVAEKLLRASLGEKPSIELKWAGEDFTFHITAGMDGFPWGTKDLTTLEISLLEVGSRVHSPEMLYILFVGTFKEASEAVLSYCKLFEAQMTALTRPDRPPFLFSHNDQKFQYRFKFAGMAGDQKGHSTMVGQKNQAANMFSPYILVHKDDKRVLFGSVGTKEKTWKPITYELRKQWLAEADVLVAEHQANNNNKPPSKEVLDKMLRDRNNPQKIEPPIGPLSDHIYVDTLHLGINSLTKWLEGFKFGFIDELNKFLMDPGIKCPNAPQPQVCNSYPFSRVQEIDQKESAEGQVGVPIVRFVHFIAKNMKMPRVAKQLRSSWNQKHGSLMFRLTGHDVRMLCQRSPALIQFFHGVLEQVQFDDTLAGTMLALRQRLDFLHFVALLLRKIMTVASRSEVTEEMIASLEKLCVRYQNIKVCVSRSSHFDFHHQIDHTLSYVLPYQAREFFTKYPGQGIAKLSMQGHEKIHQDTKNVLKTTHPGKKWPQLYEFNEIMTNYLPVALGKVGQSYAPVKNYYTPLHAQHIGLLDMKCEIPDCQSCAESEDLIQGAETGTICDDFGAFP